MRIRQLHILTVLHEQALRLCNRINEHQDRNVNFKSRLLHLRKPKQCFSKKSVLAGSKVNLERAPKKTESRQAYYGWFKSSQNCKWLTNFFISQRKQQHYSCQNLSKFYPGWLQTVILFLQNIQTEQKLYINIHTFDHILDVCMGVRKLVLTASRDKPPSWPMQDLWGQDTWLAPALL